MFHYVALSKSEDLWENVRVRKERWNGLKFLEVTSSPHTSMSAITDTALMRYGIPTLSDDELMRQLKERGLEAEIKK